MSTKISIQELRQGLKEIQELQKQNAIQIQDTDRLLKQVGLQMQDTDEQMKDTDLRLKETDRIMKETEKKLNKTIQLFEDQWSKLVESLVEGCLDKLLKSKNIDVHRTSTRVHGTYKDQQYEFDIIAHNEVEIVIVEVKSTLNVSKVNDFLHELSQVKIWLHEYKHYKVYGAVAYLRSDEASAKFAEKNGLFVIKATGDSAVLVNENDFIPNIW